MGIIYYVTIPSMYLFLIIYAVFNLNVVSWGTREVILASTCNKPCNDAPLLQCAKFVVPSFPVGSQEEDS